LPEPTGPATPTRNGCSLVTRSPPELDD